MGVRHQDDSPTVSPDGAAPAPSSGSRSQRVKILSFMGKRSSKTDGTTASSSEDSIEKQSSPAKRSTLGILADKETDEVPGTVILLSNVHQNAPLGGEKTEQVNNGAGSNPVQQNHDIDFDSAKRTDDGKIVLNPQPEDTPNDPLNWPIWRRNVALLCLGFYSMLGGGMTTVLAAGFNNVARTYQVTFSKVALTTGLYMMGLGVGSVIFSPTAYLYGKRTVYLASAILFVISSIWCALAPNYANLVVARVFQGIAVSPVECLPSATIAEIFFLHERAFRIGIYTLLLLGGKNLIPLVSAAIIQAKGWRWVFWVVAIVVGFSGTLVFFFVPETIWDRTPRRPRRLSRNRASLTSLRSGLGCSFGRATPRSSLEHRRSRSTARQPPREADDEVLTISVSNETPGPTLHRDAAVVHFANNGHARHQVDTDTTSDWCESKEGNEDGPTDHQNSTLPSSWHGSARCRRMSSAPTETDQFPNATDAKSTAQEHIDSLRLRYTMELRNAAPVSYLQTLRPWNGRLSNASWLKVCFRPFVLYAYPAVLWSAMVYALSVGWLIVLSEAVAHVYETQDSYNFTAIQVGLVYLSPFVGGVLGTAVAGRLSDVIVRWMARRNNGIYEPEYRLVMAIPIAISTAIGLMGFGWSAQERDNFMVPTVFFGVISFGCCMGSTTAITYCVDSYRQFAGEALVTLNFSKNILHGLVWSLFFPQWLESSGSKDVFLAIGGIQIACLLFSIPMYIYGKRARMWTVRMKMMERF